MKLSVSLPPEDVDLLDQYAHAEGLGSRSAVVQHALRLLRLSRLSADYADAWAEWQREDEALWVAATSDGPTR